MPSHQKQIIKQEGNPNDTKTFALKGRAPTRIRDYGKYYVEPVEIDGGAVGAQSCNIKWRKI